MDRKLERASSLTGSVALIVWNSPRRGLFRYLSGGKRRYIYRERGGRPIQPPAVSRRVNARSILPLCWLSGLMRSRTQRSGADVAELFIDCFYPVPRFTERRYYLSTWRVVQILYAQYFFPAFLLSIFHNDPCTRARQIHSISYRVRHITIRNNNRYKLKKKKLPQKKIEYFLFRFFTGHPHNVSIILYC